MSSFTDIFFRPPVQWGLRGDQFLWDDMKHLLAATRFPHSVSKAQAVIERAFFDLTGSPISSSSEFRLDKYSYGGMSSGGIDPAYWRSTIVPNLLENFADTVERTKFMTGNYPPTEKILDLALDDAFKTNPDFVQWFLSKTKFASERANYLWSRSNSPWCRIKMEFHNEATGAMETIDRESETDVLVVFETDEGRRFAVHIENKLRTGSFTAYQVEMYPIRAAKWQGDSKFKSYSDWETVLVAPEYFVDRYRPACSKFGKIITHEELQEFVPAFDYQVSLP
jgi:hypothetical protein